MRNRSWRLATLITIGVSLAVAVSVTLVTVLEVQRERTAFRDDLEEDALLMAGELHDIIANRLYFSDADGLKEITRQVTDARLDMTYMRISGADGRVIADSLGPKYPAGMLDERSIQRRGPETSYAYTGDGLEVTSEIAAGTDVLGLLEFGFSESVLAARVRSIVVRHVWQGLIAILLGAALSYLIAKYASRPIEALADVASSLGGGDLDSSVPITGTREGRTLGNALESMRVQLRALYSDLEERVVKRTQELADANSRLTDEMAARARSEKERQTLEVNALAQSKLATLGEVATGVAHEINQPLTYIDTMIQTTKEDFELKDVDEQRVVHRLIESRKYVGRINEIIDHLRTFGRDDEDELAPVDLSVVVDNALLEVPSKSV